MIQHGIISLMDQNAPTSALHIMSKLDKHPEDWRPCGDFRVSNALPISDRYPVLHNQDCVSSLHVKVICSIIDLVRAYHQITVARDDLPREN